VRFEPDRVVVTVALKRRRLRCPKCSYTTPHRESKQHHDSVWRHVDLGARRRLEIPARLRRLRCPEHGVHVEGVPFARDGARFTRDFEDLVATCSAVSLRHSPDSNRASRRDGPIHGEHASVPRRSSRHRWGVAVCTGRAALRELLSDRGHSLTSMPFRNELCPCGSGRKFKRCCLERLEAVARELRARDELLDDVVAWLRAEHEQTIYEVGSETAWIRMLGGDIGRSMSLVWALADYVPDDGGPPLMARYAERCELSPPARAIARGLAGARLDVYRVGSTVSGLWLELEPLTGMPVRLGWLDGLERVQIGEIVVARVVHATTMPTVWGLGTCFPADSERRWKARLAALPTDPAEAALIVLGFRPDDTAEPVADGIELHTLTWSISDDESVLEALEDEDLWESLGEAIPSGWVFAWPEEASSGGRDLGGWREHAGEIEVARLIVGERDIALLSADRGTLLEIASHLEESLRGLIAPRPDALAA
jgi:SEC-C motif